MLRKILVVVLIVLALSSIASAVEYGIYQAGHTDAAWAPGHVTPVGPDGYRYGHPGMVFFPGFFAFPVFWVIVIVLIVTRRRRWGHWGPGGRRFAACGYDGPQAAFDEWHRQAHTGPGTAQTGAAPVQGGGAPAQPGGAPPKAGEDRPPEDQV